MSENIQYNRHSFNFSPHDSFGPDVNSRENWRRGGNPLRSVQDGTSSSRYHLSMHGSAAQPIYDASAMSFSNSGFRSLDPGTGFDHGEQPNGFQQTLSHSFGPTSPPTIQPLLPGRYDDDSDEDLPTVDRIMESSGADRQSKHKQGEGLASRQPARRVAGQRVMDRKGKGKQRASPSPGPSRKRKASTVRPSTTPAPVEKKARGRSGGRAPGIANYSDEDLDALFDILLQVVPVGGNGWLEVEKEFKLFAQLNGRPERTAKSLEAKFKQLAKTRKPTGDGEIPANVERALEIEEEMNKKAGTQDLDDNDIIDVDADDDDDEIEEIEEPPRRPVVKKEPKDVKPTATQLRLASASGQRRGHRSGQEVLNNIASVLSPEAQQTRSEEASLRSFQSIQMMGMQSQLENLRGQLVVAERERNDALRRADRAELMLTMHPQRGRSSSAHRTYTPRVRQEVHYRGGGRTNQWLDPNDVGDREVMSGAMDSPHTRRFTLENHLSSPSPAGPSISIPTRLQSVLSTPSAPRIQRNGDFAVTFTPTGTSHGVASTLSVVLSPHGDLSPPDDNDV